MKDKIYKLLPHFFQNILVSLYNLKEYRTRYGGAYPKYLKEKFENRSLSLSQLKKLQKDRYEYLINFAISHSPYYKRILADIPEVSNINQIHLVPIINKEVLRSNIDEIIAHTDEKLEISKTGGTTGASLIVKNFKRNTQERFAFMEDFRSRQGYKLGKKTAWFSGKDLLTSRDVKRNRFWKTDYIYHVRYYSTFHIKKEYLKFYVENLIKFAPEYMVGFPSTMLDIAKFGLNNGYTFPENTIKAIFPTAETITSEMRETIESFFKTKLFDHYASSEGAPFIFQCEKGNYHLELQSGVYEVLDENDKQVQSGRLIVTSFTNQGTPLIRYDIGDRITMEDENKVCPCGNHNPMVKEILGRIDDYVYSPKNGKINIVNIANSSKNTIGIKQFQVIQSELNKIQLKINIDKKLYTKNIEKIFLNNWRDRVGTEMEIEISYVDEIPVEASGKFRIVKNNIKHLIN